MIRHLALPLAYGLAGAVLVLLVVFVWFVNHKPDLEVWHTADLDEEFTDGSAVDDFEAYLALEERLFAQLEERVFERIEEDDRRQINRFHRGSLSDPGRRDPAGAQLRLFSPPRLPICIWHPLRRG